MSHKWDPRAKPPKWRTAPRAVCVKCGMLRFWLNGVIEYRRGKTIISKTYAPMCAGVL